MTNPLEPLEMSRGPNWANRIMLAPLTNLQSHRDGVMSDDEFNWLTKRAEGGFGLTMTCASHVREQGIGFPGQLGIWGDHQLEGLTRLATKLNSEGTHSSVQLHHAGMRTLPGLIETPPECPSDNEEYGAKALTLDEVIEVREDFVAAAVRAEKAGFHGVELHAAHGYLICQFLSAKVNLREDEYGGSLENRARFLFEIVDRIREETGPDFCLGIRLSPERFGLRVPEIKSVAQQLMDEDKIDYIDFSLWDLYKKPFDPSQQDKTLVEHFTELNRGRVKIGGAGGIWSGADVQRALDSGLDFVTVGQSGILHHDFPRKLATDPNFVPTSLPVSIDYLKAEGVGDRFVKYLQNIREDFVDA